MWEVKMLDLSSGQEEGKVVLVVKDEAQLITSLSKG